VCSRIVTTTFSYVFVSVCATFFGTSAGCVFLWLVGFIKEMVSLHELVEDSEGEVSSLKVTILAVAAVHVIALVRQGLGFG